MFWDILKIEPTADKKKITAAYRKLLAVTSPEDDQEAFMALRNAYEEALAYAEAHSENRVLTPVEIWERDLRELYDSFQRRNDISEWQKLFNEEVCASLDTRMRCEEVLLRFLSENYFITHDVWVYFDQQFSWSERQNELYENYPADLIDYVVMNGIRFNDTLPMNMFIPGRDSDECYKYLNLYLKLRRQEGDPLETAAEMASLKEQHPYGQAAVLSYKAEVLKDASAVPELKKIHEAYPKDAYIAMSLAGALSENGYDDECLALSKKMQEIYPGHENFCWYEAVSLGNKGEYAAAVKILDKLIGDAGGDFQRRYELDQKRREINQHIIKDLEKKSGEGAEDSVLMDLAWAYLENNMIEKADALVKRVSDTYDDHFNYLNLRSYIAMDQGKTKDAAGYLRELIEVTKMIPEDSEKNIRRKGRLSEMYARLGSALYEDDHEKAMEAYEQSLSTAENPVDILDQLTGIYLQERKYDKAEEAARRLIDVNPGGYRGYLALAYAMYFTRRDRDAYNAIEHALDLDRTDLQTYLLRARILIRNDAGEGAKQICEFLVNSGMEDEPSVLFLRGVIADDLDKDTEKAEEYYARSMEKIDRDGSGFTYKSELAYRYLYLYGDHHNADLEEDRNEMLRLADEGLKANPDHYGLLDYKAWLLERGKEYDEALKIYLKLAENPNHGANVDAAIGHIYYRDPAKNADLVLKYYLAALEKGGSSAGHFYAGMAYFYMLELEKAEEQFILLKEKEPDSVDGYYRLSYVYAMQNRLEEALENARQSVEIMKGRKGNYSSYFKHLSDVLRRMKRYDEAVDVIREAMDLYDYPQGRRLIFDIYCQAGRFGHAVAHLQEWGKKYGHDREYLDCSILLHMYRNEFDSAFLENKLVSKSLEADRSYEVKHILSRYYENYKKEYNELKDWLEYREKNDVFDISRIKGALAMCCFRMNDMEQAQRYASEAIEDIDQKLALFEPDRLLFMARKIRLLAILGKEEEARELVRECGKTPMCQFCPEHRCKDVDLFRMEMEEVFGNDETVYEMADKGHEMYPGEEEFIIEKHMMKKKVRKKEC